MVLCGPMKTIASRCAVATLLALIVLVLAWELSLAPLRPGGSWAVLKVLPLLLPLRGLLRQSRYTAQWSSMLILAYFCEGVVRAWSDSGAGRACALAEIALAILFFSAVIVSVRAGRVSRQATPPRRAQPS